MILVLSVNKSGAYKRLLYVIKWQTEKNMNGTLYLSLTICTQGKETLFYAHRKKQTAIFVGRH